MIQECRCLYRNRSSQSETVTAEIARSSAHRDGLRGQGVRTASDTTWRGPLPTPTGAVNAT